MESLDWERELEEALLGRTILGWKGKEPFWLKEEQLRRHLLVFGAPGSGKTRFLSLLAKVHLERGDVLILLDPHGTKPESLYELVLAEVLDLGLEEDLILFDPSFGGYTLAWNPTKRNSLPPSTQAEFLLEAVSKACKDFLSQEQRPQHERWLLNTLEYLIWKDRPLIDALEILRGEEFFELVESEILEAELDYYSRQTPKRREELVESVFNRLRRILSSPALLETFSRSEGRFHLSELIEEPKIILFNLGTSPRLSRRASTLLGSLLLAEVVMALELRGRKEPLCAVICDEASRFITPDLAVAFAELRGYGCSVVLAAQSLYQLEDEERKTLETCMACSETIVAFRLGFEDAERLAQEFLRYDPYLLKEELSQRKFEPHLKEISLSSFSDSRSYLRGEEVQFTEAFGESQSYLTDYLPFDEVSSRSFFSLEEQIRLLAERIRDLPDRRAFLWTKEGLELFEVAEVLDAEFSREELERLYLTLFKENPLYVKIETEDEPL